MASLLQQPSRETIQLGSLTVPRLFVGLWQLSGPGWGTTSIPRIRREMLRHVEAGYTAFDMVSTHSTRFPSQSSPFIPDEINSFHEPSSSLSLIFKADHYGTAEQIFGSFREKLPDQEAVVGATKWCVFKATDVTRALVQEVIDERNTRMCSKRVDLLQFHWQHYSDRQYMDALTHLQDIKNAGDIKEVGLVNFDSAHMDEICTQFPGLIVSHQVAFSVIDTRPLDGMAHVCSKHGIKLLTYGTLCGGFLSDKWLDEPQPDSYDSSLTPSQRKYLDMIVGAWGTWSLFQELLQAMRTIGEQHQGRSISNVATRWVLDHDFVGCVLIGSRLGLSEHVNDNDRVYGFRLTVADNAAIESILSRSNGRNLIRSVGDCGAEYRRNE